ncbi:hypothetical protein FQN54_001286 [Arachnomyces sp. PD_36]|nr:hypothetical protein FQN54_001286 [Arachnomyces sp. PD_36]
MTVEQQANASEGAPLGPNGVSAAKATERKKLFGREFYKSLGSPTMILAPMVDRSEFAWRVLTRSYMDPKSSNDLLAYSPMLHARLFQENATFRCQYFQPTRPAQPAADGSSTEGTVPHLDGNPAIDRPLIVQFCANKPDELLQAGQHVQTFCDAVDLNLGCPQGIAKKGHYGAFLQEDWDLIYKLINKLHKELSIPVTAKFRILETKEKTLEYAKMILSAGASIISVHGRRREQKGHNTGLADWSYIRYLRDNLPPETVIFANGNILNHSDIEKCLEATGADGVMSAEGNLTDPTIFGQAPPVGQEGREYWRGKDGIGGYRLDAVLRRYMDIIYKYVLEVPGPERKPLFLPSDPVKEEPRLGSPKKDGEDAEDGPPKKKQKRGKEQKVTSPSLTAMQGHLFQLLRPLVSKHTNVRDCLAKTKAGNMAGFENIVSLVEGVVKAGIQEYEQFPERFDKPEASSSTDGGLTGSKATIAEYKRPWWVCQPHVRPLPEEAIEKGALQLKKKDKEAAKKEDQSCTPTEASVLSETKATNVASESTLENGVSSTPDALVSG